MSVIVKHFLIRPFKRDTGANDRADTGAADTIDLETGFAQCAHDTDLGKTARTATGKHQAQAASGEQARHASHIVRIANVVVADQRRLRQPAPRSTLDQIARMQEDQMTWS